MRQFFVLLVFLALMNAVTYVQGAEQVPPFAIAQFDKDQLFNRLATLKPFQSEKGGAGLGYAFSVTKEEFRNSLIFLSQEKADEVMRDFGMAVGFLFKDKDQLLTLTQWRDRESAKRFVQVESELWHLKDAEYKQYIQDVVYKEIDIERDEKALLTRKTIAQAGQKQDITTFVSVRKNYLFECNLIGTYNDSDVQKLVLQIWKIVESEEKKGTR